MRRFFIALFVISLIATAGTLYWRTYMPERPAPVVAQREFRSAPSDATDGRARESLPTVERTASERQDLAVTISIISSVVSALAAVIQTLLTARAYRR